MRRQIHFFEYKEGTCLNFFDAESFYYIEEDFPLFPETAVINREGVTLCYPETETNYKVLHTSEKNYALLKGLFDEKNPIPWEEVDKRPKPRPQDISHG